MLNFGRVQFAGVASSLGQAPKDGLPEVVLAGRSNAGKSSLVNALANHRNLAKVSQTPGKTQLVVYFNIDQKLYLVDLPGYGYAKDRQAKSRFQKLADSYFNQDRPIRSVLLLLDIRHDPSMQDQQMYAFLRERQFPHALLLAKSDKLSRSMLFKRKQDILRVLQAPADTPCFPVSSLKKSGLDPVRAYLSSLLLSETDETSGLAVPF